MIKMMKRKKKKTNNENEYSIYRDITEIAKENN